MNIKSMRRLMGAGAAGLVLTAVAAAGAMAYTSTVASTVDCGAPTTVVKGSATKVTALVQGATDGANLAPIANKQVTWSATPSGANVTFNPPKSVTNSSGIATTYVTVNDSSTVTVRATADNAACTSNVKVATSGLPNTSTMADVDLRLPVLFGIITGLAMGMAFISLRRPVPSRS
jgi:hypothetical protein